MKILVTGHNGYIGSVMVPMIVASGHEVTGLDTGLFEDCIFGERPARVPTLRKDIRDVSAADLNGFDAIIHLAALSNDPLGDLNPQCTYDINHLASVKLANVAKRASVPRFLFTSSCSLYGVAGGENMLREDAAFNPITPYGESKVRAERDIEKLADETFSPVFLRCATAYGVSPRLRADVVVNNLVGVAFTTGEVLIKSDGTPWRPLVHIEDITRAFLAVLHAPRELIHNQAFNVGATKENYQIRDVADIVRQVVPGSKIQYAEDAGPDPRCYRVDCSKLATVLPEFQPRWTVRLGAEQLYEAFKRNGTKAEEFLGDRYTRLKHLRTLMKSGQLDEALRWRIATPA